LADRFLAAVYPVFTSAPDPRISPNFLARDALFEAAI
jgi:hypothetical protein